MEQQRREGILHKGVFVEFCGVDWGQTILHTRRLVFHGTAQDHDAQQCWHDSATRSGEWILYSTALDIGFLEKESLYILNENYT